MYTNVENFQQEKMTFQKWRFHTNVTGMKTQFPTSFCKIQNDHHNQPVDVKQQYKQTINWIDEAERMWWTKADRRFFYYKSTQCILKKLEIKASYLDTRTIAGIQLHLRQKQKETYDRFPWTFRKKQSTAGADPNTVRRRSPVERRPIHTDHRQRFLRLGEFIHFVNNKIIKIR